VKQELPGRSEGVTDYCKRLPRVCGGTRGDRCWRRSHPSTRSHAVELIRFALYLCFAPFSCTVLLAYLVVFVFAAVIGYDSGRGLWSRRGEQ
jgi:hypothetical protein